MLKFVLYVMLVGAVMLIRGEMVIPNEVLRSTELVFAAGVTLKEENVTLVVQPPIITPEETE